MGKGGFIEDIVIQFYREMPTQESRINEFQEEQTKVVLIQGQQGSNHQYNGQITETEEIITRDSHTNQNQNQIIRLDSNQLKHFDEKQIILQTNSSNDENENGQGPMKVFIINQPVKNVIQAGNNLIVETETPIKTEDLNPGSNGGGQQLGNNDQLSILPHGQEEIHSPSSSVSSSNALVGFDPSKRSFTEEELRPSPIRTKTKKRAVPDNEKDSTYWERRAKNNLAAKRSRESRRNRDNQVTERTAFLENENINLRNRINEVRSEILDVKEKLQQYQIMFRNPEIQKQANEAMNAL